MPELPEVEHVKRGIEPFVINEKIDKVIFSEKVIEGKNNQRETIIKGIELDSFKKLTEGYVISEVLRRSKYIVFHIEKDNDR
ncbi:TPA: DNA-formamidopyrimidine glycosylase, partial [Escherichia coli]|nr:DNA-formamidopyrimidine glycosylase [Escherichia coli]